VRAIARLARLELTEDEVDRMAGELGRIVELASGLAEVLDEPGFEALEPFEHERDARALRPDEPRPPLARDAVLAQAPDTHEGGFAVPTFVDEG
jgi:aspartyl-tRNA(Asn)/glutamyl-tRNA(Gln) amidotransferase subunit C